MADNKLFVGNLPYTVTDEDLRSKFSEAGEVVSARVISDRETHRPRGFGFVEMATPQQAAEAKERLNETSLQGRNILVKDAEQKEARGGRRF